MAADEPPYLNIGTDVSAKYKGAFCEAKIKKVNRVVKCKVTFKNNLGSFVVTDDLIKGPLRVNAEVEAKHPEKNQFSEAIINKLQDYSQYTVVFDDGDETTLRRTSLCLKSGRHFAESPTLDQFPLTNPEHFGTPVIGSGKFKRKRRSTVNSSLDYESSDEDSLPRKLKAIRGKEKDPDLGKVVCVDFGDRRKKDNWYPGLIVPLPPQSNIKISKEEHLIRSFKDGKYYQVPKRDIREFNKEYGNKVENNALRIAVEKAVNYLEKEELPPHWDKVLFCGLEDDESNDSETDTSDDEPSEEKDRFVAQLYKFMDERGTPINKAPCVSNRDLNLYKLFKIMHKLGGYNKVTNKNKWKTVYSKMGLPHTVANGPTQMKFAYKRYLQSFEDFYRKLGCTMVNNSRSTRGRHRSDRNIIITRTRGDTASPKSKNGKESRERSTSERRAEEKSKSAEKKETKAEESSKSEEKSKGAEKRKVDEEKRKEERKRSSLQKEEDTKPEKARTREDARKEKNDSPEKKGTRSSSKADSEKREKEDSLKEKKVVKEKKDEKPVKEEKSKKENTPTKERKVSREKKPEEKPTSKEKREVPTRDKKEVAKDKKDVKAKKEEPSKGVQQEEKSPKRKLERAVKRDSSKTKSEEGDSEKKEEKPSMVPEVKDVQETPKKPKLKRESSISSEEVKPAAAEDAASEEKKVKVKNESEEEPPNKGKKKFLKSEDKEDSFLGYSDSDESLTNDSEKAGKDLKKEIEVGDRVKVKYGRGRMQKVYEAKVLKTEADGIEKRYYVHYAGWNMRYDEWVRKNYIVAIINGNKKHESSSKSNLPPSVKKQERIRLPGSKPARKNSTSSTNSSVSRSARIDRKEESDSKTKPKKFDTSMADTSQDSDSEREDDEGNDADVEDSSAPQIDSCFEKEPLDAKEVKVKTETIKQETSPENVSKSEDSASFKNVKPLETIPKEDIKCEKTDTEVVHSPEPRKTLTCEPLPVVEPAPTVKTEEPSEDEALNSVDSQVSCPPSTPAETETKLPSSSEASQTKSLPSFTSSDSFSSKPSSALSFSGLINRSETTVASVAKQVSVDSEFTPLVATDSAPKQSDSMVDTLKLEANSQSKSSEVDEEKLPPKIDDLSVKELPPEKSVISQESVSSVESSKTDTKTDTPITCLGLFASKSTDDKQESEKSVETEESIETKGESEQNIFMPSFSPHTVDQSFIKMSSESCIPSDTVDVSKMIPGILERLKTDDATESDSPLPPKNELSFGFLRESTAKYLSRSESSSSLRICESDTNDSNTDFKDLGLKTTTVPNLEDLNEAESDTKSTAVETVETDSIPAVTDSKEVEENNVVPSENSNADNEMEPMSIFKQMVTPPADNEEKPTEQESFLELAKPIANNTEPEVSPTQTAEVVASSQSSVADSEDTKDTLFKDQIEEQPFEVPEVTKFEPADEQSPVNKDSSEKEDVTSVTNSTNSPKETSDSVSNVGFPLNSLSEKLDSSEQNSPHSDERTGFTPIDTLRNMAAYSLKKEGKKKKLGKKFGKKFGSTEFSEKDERESKIAKEGKTKTKKKMRLDSFSGDRGRSLDLKSKSKKLKKNKNKKRFKREDSCESYIKKDDNEMKDFDKLKRKEKKKLDKKFFKTGPKNEDGGENKMDALKKKKGKKEQR